MTGFGSSLEEEDGRRVDVELRSVNHRHVKVVLKVPGSLSAHETEIENRIRTAVRRGTVTARIRYHDAQQPPRYHIDVEAARSLGENLQEVEAALGEAGPADGRHLPMVLRLPGVVCPSEEVSAVSPEGWSMIQDALGQGISELIAAREREGSHLVSVLEAQAATVGKLVIQARERAQEIVPEQRDRLLVRVKRLIEDLDVSVPLSEPDVLRETCLLADRLDVTEELDRMVGHLEAIDGILKNSDEAGRKLDFLLQELGREINTVGSKANDTNLAHLVVEMKCEIERMREQVQNLE